MTPDDLIRIAGVKAAKEIMREYGGGLHYIPADPDLKKQAIICRCLQSGMTIEEIEQLGISKEWIRKVRIRVRSESTLPLF